MSNARSPREVCSTTIGTSGLIFLALVSLRCPDSSKRLARRRSRIAGGPQLAGRLGRLRAGGLALAVLAGRPQLLARLRLLRRDRGRSVGDQLDGEPRREILAQLVEAPGGTQVLEQLRRLGLLALGDGRDRLEQLLPARLGLLGGDDRAQHSLT